MPRLYRPHIPLSVRISVAHRQIQKAGRQTAVFEGVTKRSQLDGLLRFLAHCLGCDVSDLRLDHDPPLAARPQERRGLGKKTYYIPEANDPDHLFYRPHGPEFAGSHLIKTNVRGDNGQHPDRVLIKKAKRLERGPRPKRPSGFKKSAAKRPWPSRPFPSSKGRN